MIIPLFIGAAILYLASKDRTVSRVKEGLEEWETELDDERTESDYRAELAEFLRDDDCYLIEESGVRRGRRDIWIRDVDSNTEVVVELKLNLSSANEVRRLIGQIASYSEDAKAIFVVLIEPDGNMADELEISLQALQCRERVEVVYIEAEDDDEMSPTRTMTTLIMTNDLNETLIQPILVRALPNYHVYLEFSDGAKGIVDLSNLRGKGVFEIWNDYAVFEKVHIGEHREIKWNDDIELCADMLYLRLTGKTPEEFLK